MQKQLRIMVIDAHGDTLTWAGDLLTTAGYEVDLYLYMQQVTSVHNHAPDLILFDWAMPNGEINRRLFRELRQDLLTAAIPLLLWTAALSTPVTQAVWSDRWRIGIVPKPTEWVVLAGAVRETLERWSRLQLAVASTDSLIGELDRRNAKREATLDADAAIER